MKLADKLRLIWKMLQTAEVTGTAIARRSPRPFRFSASKVGSLKVHVSASRWERHRHPVFVHLARRNERLAERLLSPEVTAMRTKDPHLPAELRNPDLSRMYKEG